MESGEKIEALVVRGQRMVLCAQLYPRTWMRALGLPVLTGPSTSLCFFFVFFVAPDFDAAYRPQFLRYLGENLQAHYLGGIHPFRQYLGVDPLGEIFFPNFPQNFDLKFEGNHAQAKEKKLFKNFWDLSHRA